MADVVPGYVPVDGALFNPSGWNTDLRSTTDGVSVYGELNGHIQDENFAAGTGIINSRHIRPLEGFRSEWGGQVDTTDWYELLWGTAYDPDAWLFVPGAARRVYVPWDASVVQYQCSAFGTNFRTREYNGVPPDGAPVYTGPLMYVCMFVDGVRIAHTQRVLPYSAWPLANPGTPNYFKTIEQYLSHHFDLVHMAGPVSKGWHDVSLAVQVLQNLGQETMYALYAGGAADQLTPHSVTHRLRLGIRAASILALP